MAGIFRVNSAPSLVDPRELERFSVVAANVYRATATESASTASAFFTGGVDAIDRIPGAADVDSNFTTSYKTLLSYTGSGFLTNIVGPTLATAADTVTFEITIDGGTAVEVVLTAQANTSRCILGPIKKEGDVTTAVVYKGIEATGVASDSKTLYAAGNQTIVSPSDLIRDGFIPLRFNTSILVRGKTSATVSATVNQERRCAVLVRNLS